jgi:hypothetical protein
MTGVRRGPVARRRVRGAHKGLKKPAIDHLMQAVMMAGAGVAVVAVLALQHSTPAQVIQVDRGGTPQAKAVQPHVVGQAATTLPPKAEIASIASLPPLPVGIKPPQQPVRLPILPPLPQLPHLR